MLVEWYKMVGGIFGGTLRRNSTEVYLVPVIKKDGANANHCVCAFFCQAMRQVSLVD